MKLLPDDAAVEQAEVELARAVAAGADGREDSARIEVPLEALLGAEMRLREVAAEVVRHFEGRRQAIEGKGMIVVENRRICMDLYDQIIELRPDWADSDDRRGSLKVVMSGSAGEGPRIASHARSRSRRDALAARFRDPADEFRLAIVCDMWLTGFDCPPLHTMYLDRPLAGHGLMQAIARVNRVFGNKPGGVVVDFFGLASELRDAVRTYTEAGGVGQPIETVQADAVPVMQRTYEALSDLHWSRSQ